MPRGRWGGYQYHWMLPLPIRTGAVQRFPIPVTIHSRGQIVEQKRCIGFNFPGRPNLRADRCIPWWGFYPTIILPSYYEVLLWGSYPTLVPSYYYYLPTIPLFRPRPTIIPCRCRINPRGPRDDILRGLLEHRVNGNRWACYVPTILRA